MIAKKPQPFLSKPFVHKGCVAPLNVQLIELYIQLDGTWNFYHGPRITFERIQFPPFNIFFTYFDFFSCNQCLKCMDF